MKTLTAVLIALTVTAGAYDPVETAGAITTVTENGTELESALVIITDRDEALLVTSEALNEKQAELDTAIAEIATLEATIETLEAATPEPTTPAESWQALTDHYITRVGETGGQVENPFRIFQAITQAGVDAETAIENGAVLEGDGSDLTIRFFAWRLFEALYARFPDPRIPTE